jgi:hypothetical protein
MLVGVFGHQVVIPALRLVFGKRILRRPFRPRGGLPRIPCPLSSLSVPLDGFYDRAAPKGACTALGASMGLSGASTASRTRSLGLS